VDTIRRDDRKGKRRPPSARLAIWLFDHRQPAESFAIRLTVRAPRRSLRQFLGQAVAGDLLFWRGRRLRGALTAAVVDPGLRPRFFSVLPTPANFRSR
jgi:hypothetical protein